MGKEKDKEKRAQTVQKIKKSLEKAGKEKRSSSILYVNAKGIKNKERRKELVYRQKIEARKVKKLQKLKEKKIRIEQGEDVFRFCIMC